jgi:hypothetical protein
MLDWGPATAEAPDAAAFMADIARRAAALPLPLHAQQFLGRLESKGFESHDAIAHEAAALAGEPAAVTRGRRVAHLLVASLPTVIMSAIMSATALLIIVAQGSAGPVLDLTELLMRLDTLEKSPQQARPGEQRALEVYVASRYRALAEDERTWKDGWTLLRFNPRLRDVARRAIARHPSPSGEDVVQASAIVEPYLKREREKAEKRTSTRGLLSILGLFAAGATIVIGALGLLSALLFRGGLLLRLLGIAIVTAHGEAGRLRAFWRAVIAWSPAVLSGAAILLGDPNPMERTWWLVLEALSLTLLLGGFVYAIRNPQRGVQDRLAGTWLVPR